MNPQFCLVKAIYLHKNDKQQIVTTKISWSKRETELTKLF